MNPTLLLWSPLLPLVAAVIAGLFGRRIGRAASHWITSLAVAGSCALSGKIAWDLFSGHVGVYNGTVYTWLVSDGISMEVGFLVDQLPALRMVVVTFVSLCVHV